MESQRIYVAVIGHSFVRRARADICRLLERTECVAGHIVRGFGGMTFEDSRFQSCLDEVSQIESPYPVVLVLFLGDNDIFPKGMDALSELKHPLQSIAFHFFEHLKQTRLATGAKIYYVAPAMRRNKPIYNGIVPFVEYGLKKLACHRKWLYILSREYGGGSDPSQTSDDVHPHPHFQQSWILDYITHSISHATSS